MAQYELNVLDYWLIIRKRKFTIAVTAALVIVFTFALSQFLKPMPVYEASARVKFDRTSTLANLLLESLSTQTGNDLGTQSEVIRSFPVIEEVAKTLSLVPADAAAEDRKSATYLSTVYALQQQVKASQEGSTNILKITAVGDNGQTVARMANAVAESYRVENIKSRNRIVTDSRRFVEQQLAILEAKLRAAEDALREFKEREGQVFLNEEAKAALETFTKLEGDYNRILRQKDEAQKQIEVLKRREALPGQPQEERIFTEEPSALLSVLNARLLDLNQERSHLLINYTPQHPQVKELDRKIMNVKAEMARELDSKVKSLTDRELALKEQIDRYRDRYFSFPKAAIELARLEREVKVNTDLYATLKIKHQELLIKSSEQIEEVTIIEPAVPPPAPMNAPNDQLNMVVGTVMGLFLGIMLAFMRESFDTSIGTIEGVEEYLKVPVLGVIPRFEESELKEAAAKELGPEVPADTLDVFSKLVCLYDPKSVLSEGFRSLRTNIQFATMEHDVKSMLFTSAGLGEGKTTTIINLAITMAQDGKRVLLVDADLRRPLVHARLGLPREPGLSDALLGERRWSDSVRTVTDLMLGTLGIDRVIHTPGLDNLNVLTSGATPQNPAEYLNAPKVGDLLAEMKKEYDIVLFDTPPILPIADAVMMSSRVDGVVLVYQVGRIGRNALRRAKFLLDHAQAKVLGIVLTNVRAEITPEYGYYRYEYR
ncbi:MAG TPA: polysaccharide biosynthesis tyrosine autokinase [Nitrospiraceae bacterium]|jgi:capsular exopolysaccharide synthesis family protein|nr:polysaccharide biosynthesis tyrosine autokinase [Nitrospiraceae bacterium]